MIDEAVQYHERFKPQALIVERGGLVLHESYSGGFAAPDAHPLFSGTKSFWGIAAVCAEREGLLSLDEPVARTIETWRREAWKARVTLRMLLQLTAGIPFGGLGSAVPVYEKALAAELRHEPGSVFTYGGIPLQIFGAVFARKLAELRLTPHEFLEQRLLRPNDIAVAKWRTLADGTRPLPTGAFLTAQSWLAFGRHVLRNAAKYAACFRGSAVNPRYGLCWWLAFPKAPADLVYASGSGGQALYAIPSLDLLAVRFAGGGSFNHEAFVKRLCGGTLPS